MTLELRLSSMGYDCWLDQNAATITKESMQAGVQSSRVFLLFLSEGVLQRPFVVFEIQTAMSLGKKMMLLHETDGRHGAFDFGADEVQQAPPEIAGLTSTHESLPWRRRRFEQDGILAELIRLSGLSPSRYGKSAAGNRAASNGGGHHPSQPQQGQLQTEMAPVPETVPLLPEAYSPRPAEEGQVLDVLLGRTEAAQSKTKVLAHGMGGLGKTTLAACIARNDRVRGHFERLAFVSAGQEPQLLELQRAMFAMLQGEPMEIKLNATVSSQRDELHNVSAGKQWLLVLDDIWKPDAERQLCFLDEASAPRSRVFVTTRFAKLLPGYIEVALGLLSEGEAVALLLEAAEIGDAAQADPRTMAVSKRIVKLAGFLPLYVCMVSRMVYEYGASQAWQDDVVAILEEDKASVFGQGDALGARIVGGTLQQLASPEARKLFGAMAVAAEDIPTPMPALELFWCAHEQLSPPLGRIAMMKLRKNVFSLLDRNLVMGETTVGVYQHDVVRDFCRGLLHADSLRGLQRQMVGLILNATPAKGWLPTDTAALPAYVQKSLGFHMREAVYDDAADDADALQWGVDVRGRAAHTRVWSMTSEFAVATIAQTVGAPVWAAAAAAAEKRGDALVAGKLFALAGLHIFRRIGSASKALAAGGEQLAELVGLLMRGAECLAGLSMTSEEARTVEMDIRGSFMASIFFGSGDARTNENSGRMLELFELGLPLPEDSAILATVGTGIGYALGDSGVQTQPASPWAWRDNAAAAKRTAQVILNSDSLKLKAVALCPVGHISRIVTGMCTCCFNTGMVTAGMFKYSVSPVAAPFGGGHDGKVDTMYARQGGEFYPLIQELLDGYQFRQHSPLAGRYTGMDSASAWCVDAFMLIWHGDTSYARAWLTKWAHVMENEFDRSAPENYIVWLAVGYQIAFNSSRWWSRGAGHAGLGHRLLKATIGTWGDGIDAFDAAISPVFGAPWKDEEAGVGASFTSPFIADDLRANWFLVAEDAGQDPAGELRAAVLEWLPRPGFTSAGDNYLAPVFDAGRRGEIWELYERFGQYDDALELATLYSAAFPFLPAFRAGALQTAARCLAALGRPDEAEQTFQRAVSEVQASRLWFLELLLRRELLVHVLEPLGRGLEQTEPIVTLLSDRTKLVMPAGQYEAMLALNGRDKNPWSSAPKEQLGAQAQARLGGVGRAGPQG